MDELGKEGRRDIRTDHVGIRAPGGKSQSDKVDKLLYEHAFGDT